MKVLQDPGLTVPGITNQQNFILAGVGFQSPRHLSGPNRFPVALADTQEREALTAVILLAQFPC